VSLHEPGGSGLEGQEAGEPLGIGAGRYLRCDVPGKENDDVVDRG
jgi:hypothetical protein